VPISKLTKDMIHVTHERKEKFFSSYFLSLLLRALTVSTNFQIS